MTSFLIEPCKISSLFSSVERNEMDSTDSVVMMNMPNTSGGGYRSSKSSSLFTTIYNAVHLIVLLIAFSLSIYAAKTVRDLENDSNGVTGVRLSIGKPSPLSSNENSFSFFRGSGVWHHKRRLEGGARSDFQAVSIEGDKTDFVYIFGGKDVSRTYLNTVLRYDSINDSYDSMTNMPEARARYAAAVMKNDLNQTKFGSLAESPLLPRAWMADTTRIPTRSVRWFITSTRTRGEQKQEHVACHQSSKMHARLLDLTTLFISWVVTE